ncbi:MAG: hypothetical protein J6D15_00520 [Clostridia bacterium]|nr:hypothetical protein [Clostridia bacterium]
MNDFFAFLVMFGVISIFLGLFGLCVIDYVISSLGLYRLAKIGQIKKPWLSWIPGVNYWTVGSIVDGYDGKNGIKRKWRVVLPVLLGITFVCVVIYVLLLGVMAEEMIDDPYRISAEFWMSTAGMYLWMIVGGLTGSALVGCQMVCLFKVFESTAPEKAVKYFILSLIVPLAEAICLLKCANKAYLAESAGEQILADAEVATDDEIVTVAEEIAEEVVLEEE